MQKNTSSTRSCLVKLSMEVSYTTHSHIIGRSGQSINSLMKETSTKIHFPDENHIEGNTKSNTVTISGELSNVEIARRQIRKLTPVEYVVECLATMVDSYGRTKLINDFAFLHGVLVKFNERDFGPYCQVTIRGNSDELSRVQDSVAHLVKLVTKGSDVPLIAMKLEVTAANVESMKPFLPSIETQTSACITVINEMDVLVWIRGGIIGVYAARMALMNLLPVNLTMTAHANHLTFGVHERKLAKRFDVTVAIEAITSKPNSFLVSITSCEKNTENIYDFRKQILHLPAQPRDRGAGVRENSHKATKPKSGRTYRRSRENRNPQPEFRLNSSQKKQAESDDDNYSHTNHFDPKRFLPALPLCNPYNDSIPASIYALKFDTNSFRQLHHILEELDLSDYSGLMLSNEVDLAMFSTLNDTDLQSMGISSFTARRKMLHAIRELKSPSSPSKIEEVRLYQQF